MTRFLGLLLLLGIGAAALVYAYPDNELGRMLGLSEPSGQQQARQERPTPVRATQLRSETVEEMYQVTGEIVARDQVALASETAGRVEKVFADDAASVEAGDPIIAFNKADEEAALQAAIASQKQADADLRRAKRLEKENFASEARLDTAQSAAEGARAEVKQARERLKNQTVRAPFAGQIDVVNVSAGDYLNPGDPIVTIASDRLRARFSLPQRIANKVSTGAIAYVQRPGEANVIKTELAVLSPIANPRTRAFLAEAVVEKDQGFRPGMFITVEVVTRRRENAVFAPETAILRSGPDAYLFRINEQDRAERIGVELGKRKDGWIEVRSDQLSTQARVVSQGTQKIDDGALLAARDDEPPKAASQQQDGAASSSGEDAEPI